MLVQCIDGNTYFVDMKPKGNALFTKGFINARFTFYIQTICTLIVSAGLIY